MHHHHAQPAALHRARASFYTDTRLASGRRFSLYGRDVALPDRHSLGRRIAVEALLGRRWVDEGVFPVGDVCGYPGRVDFAAGTFRRLLGRKAVRRGLVDVRWRFVGEGAKREGAKPRRAKRRHRGPVVRVGRGRSIQEWRRR